MIKKTIHQEDIPFINIYICTPNIEAPKHIKQVLTDLKSETDSNTMIAHLTSSMGRSSRVKSTRKQWS